jgi:hypothetical protein
VVTAVDECGERGSDQRFFPSVRNRRQKIPILPQFTTTVTGHGKLRSYLHRFGLTDNPKCPCNEEEQQTKDYLIFRCTKLCNQRNEMIKKTLAAFGP